MLSGELGVSQAFLARWYIGGGYMDVSEVVISYDCGMHLKNFLSIFCRTKQMPSETLLCGITSFDPLTTSMMEC